MAILAFFERRNCQSPSSEIVFRQLLAFDLPGSRGSWGPEVHPVGKTQDSPVHFFPGTQIASVFFRDIGSLRETQAG